MTDRTLVLHPVIRQKNPPKMDKDPLGVDIPLPPLAPERDPMVTLEEAKGLAAAIELDVIDAQLVNVSKINPSRLIGKGAVEELQSHIKILEIDLVVVDHALTPIQQRNLEKDWKVKVIDRTGLILEIFGARARTREGMLQVELAALSYQRSRLVRSWTHLERQRGGFGFTGGPGETQIEIDRRLIDERMVKLKKELEQVKKTRVIQRRSRERIPYPVVAFVGYTNAGKSTLFNKITGAEVLAKDMLFATLDPTMRAVALPSGRKVILSDTVGFISDLPTDLVAAFRATLEEVILADVILHVQDVSQENAAAEKHDVERILNDLDINVQEDPRMIEVWNKIDLFTEDERAFHHNQAKRKENTYPVSAITYEGVDDLLQAVDDYLNRAQVDLEINLHVADGKQLSWLYHHGQVKERHDEDELIRLTVGLDPEVRDKYFKLFPTPQEEVEVS